MELVPHYIVGSMAHTNISLNNPNGPQSIDAWHVDSVPFVLIVVVSMDEQAVGGELEVVKRDGLKACREAVQAGLSEEDKLVVPYVRAGHGLVMQGSRLMHRVKGVAAGARVPRISVVWSFMPKSVVHVRDFTVVGSFLRGIDGGAGAGYQESAFEYFRGRAERASAQLDFYRENMNYTEDRKLLASKLKRTADELLKAVNELTTGGDHVGHVSDAEAAAADKRKKQQQEQEAERARRSKL
jgi:hypothetical protein